VTIKTRKLEPGLYEVVGTPLVIEKGDAPKFGMAQMWWVKSRAPEHGEWGLYLFESKGKEDAKRVLEAVLRDCAAIAKAEGGDA
jgi:hypothetical protein